MGTFCLLSIEALDCLHTLISKAHAIGYNKPKKGIKYQQRERSCSSSRVHGIVQIPIEDNFAKTLFVKYVFVNPPLQLNPSAKLRKKAETTKHFDEDFHQTSTFLLI